MLPVRTGAVQRFMHTAQLSIRLPSDRCNQSIHEALWNLRCLFVVGQLYDYMDAASTLKTHRRCRGGLLSLLRLMEAMGSMGKGMVRYLLRVASPFI